jgi:hypothetical protein
MKKATEAEMFKLIAARFPLPDYVTVAGVPDGAGFDKHRTADAVSVATWPSRGLELTGFEIKVSRSDWLKELRDGSKAESIARRCDRWYLVVSDETIVQPGELPPTWGLMARKGDKLVTVTPAPKLDGEGDLNRSFAVALLRKAAEQAPGKAEHKAALNEQYSKAYEAGRASGLRDGEYVRKELDALRETVRVFHAASGVDIGSPYTAEKIGAVVKLLIGRGHHTVLDSLKQIASIGERAGREINGALAELEKGKAEQMRPQAGGIVWTPSDVA